MHNRGYGIDAYRAAIAEHGSIRKAAAALGVNARTINRCLARNRDRDPAIQAGMDRAGATTEPRLTWVKVPATKDEPGYSILLQQPNADPIDIAEHIREALKDLAPLPLVPAPPRVAAQLMNVVPIADLHFGGEYGRPEYEAECTDTMDRVFSALPHAQKALILDLGDTTDANDHKGITPASGNPCDVIRHGLLGVTWTALRFLKHVTYRALETHAEVEVHILRGNHSETSYIAVLLGMMEHFRENPRVHVVVSDDMFRVISWGACAVMPDHGDRMTWGDLKDVWTTEFAQAWTDATAYRGIYTAHFHHDKQRDLPGVDCRHFRTMAAPSRWQKARFPAMPRSAGAVTLHKVDGFDGLIQKRLKPVPSAA